MAIARRGESAPAPSSGADAYMGMLIIAVLATLTGLILLFIDYSQFAK